LDSAQLVPPDSTPERPDSQPENLAHRVRAQPAPGPHGLLLYQTTMSAVRVMTQGEVGVVLWNAFQGRSSSISTRWREQY